jgi:D-lyxose ketol-isomerase
MKSEQVKILREKTYDLLKKAHIVITPQEKENFEIADFGLNDIENVGIQVVVYINTDRYCAKELVMFPRQICPEHRHPVIDEKNIGKQETFRCRWGEAYLYIQGEPTPNPKAKVPEKYKKYLNIWKEIILRPGDQYTLPPNSWHWFQAGDDGAIISEFSSRSIDETDVWSDPHIDRIPQYE